jgi:hypothetical protein
MAQVEGLFISESYIKNNTEIDENVNVNKLLPTVWWCQKAYIEQVLGSALFDDLLSKILASTLAGNDLTLVEKYVSPALVQWVMFEVQVPLLFNFRDKSVGKNSSDFSQPIDYTEHRYIKDNYKKRAETLTKRLEDYLCANSALFTLYGTSTTSDQIIANDLPPSTSVYMGGYYPVNKCKIYG